MDAVARHQVAARLGYADDRIAGAKFRGRDTEVGVTLDMGGGCARVAGNVEPFPAAKSSCRLVSHVGSPLEFALAGSVGN